jgi:hypothetical protein
MPTQIHVTPSFFDRSERLLVEHESLSASAFLFESGVAGLRLRNAAGQLVMLPYQGQQIWSMEFAGRNLTMKSMFDQPRPTRTYLETYGGFLLHCGATAMGVPSGPDTHPLHGELPNAPYQRAWVTVGQDDRGAYIGVSGEYQHTVAFNYNYIARPEVRLYADSTEVPVSITIQNLKRSPMPLMYLAHVNFRPVDNGRLIYSARCTPESVRVRRSIPSHIHPPAGYAEFLDELAAHPERHNVLKPGLAFDPEVVFLIDYLADEGGWAHTMQVHPDGSADFIRHRPDQLNHGVRWIARTVDQDALGMCLPATAEPEGYHAELAKGNIRTLDGGESVTHEMWTGYLPAGQAGEWESRIDSVVGEK